VPYRTRPEELYLYPLYVRPLTGLERWGRQPEDALRLSCYRAGRDLLLGEGYEQVSMRMFRRANAAAAASRRSDVGTEYCCQADGMVGLGCGARSYTRALHYSSDYAVGAVGVREIIGNYLAKDDAAFGVADYGCELDDVEQRRRWVIKSLLRVDGLDRAAYRDRFVTDALEDLPELGELRELGLANVTDDDVRLSDAGLERGDAIGPWLYSARVQETMSSFALR
jgi:oxygen-independent coproporphyrinogen III oxidase